MSRQSLIFRDLNIDDKTIIVVTHYSHVASYVGWIIRTEDGREKTDDVYWRKRLQNLKY